jgi:hypothetical protein
VKGIPNPVAFIVMIGVVVTITNVVTAPQGRHLLVLVSGLLATLLVGVIVAIAVRWRAGRQRG